MQENYEEFTPEQIQLLKHFVTNTQGSVFVLRNLPEVIKGALFSRYSRSSMGLRSLLIKDFIANSQETGFSDIVGLSELEQDNVRQIVATKKAQNFYDRILDGYGDDSIAELGGAHLAIENISMLAAKAIEDNRVGGSPLEKSTRYIYFDQKVQGEYLFYREPILMTSAYREQYIATCTMLFDTYIALIPPLTDFIQHRSPKPEGVSKSAYAASLRAKVLDCLRGLLPASALTNMGLYGNGRFFEYLLHKLHASSLVELQDIGKNAQEELNKVIPSFIRRADLQHHHNIGFTSFKENMEADLKRVTNFHDQGIPRHATQGVRLVEYDKEAVYKVAGALLYANSDKGMFELIQYCKNLSDEALWAILETGAANRENRRQKSPRALENAQFTFEILADFGAYRDLQRHRILTQERQLLSCDYDFYVPAELEESGLFDTYAKAMFQAKETYDAVAREFPEEAQYVVPMGYNIRWYFTINLRSLQWLCELRSCAAGHPAYRKIAQSMAVEVFKVLPAFERFFKFVDFEGYELGRLGQEQRSYEKKGVL